MKNKNIFPFLELSAELRDKIYTLSLTHDRFNNRLANTSLFRLSKRIHKEAQPLLLPLATFSFTPTVDHYSTLILTGDIHTSLPDYYNPTMHLFPIPLYSIPRINIDMRSFLSSSLSAVDYRRMGLLLAELAKCLDRVEMKREVKVILVPFPCVEVVRSDLWTPLVELKGKVDVELVWWDEKGEGSVIKL